MESDGGGNGEADVPMAVAAAAAPATITTDAGVNGSCDAGNKKAPEGEPKVKRKMKTAAQLEILEKTYASVFSFSFQSFFLIFPILGFNGLLGIIVFLCC